ncbi:hypothetical protein [Shinella sp. HZN7]|uniref:hypothetical protein n=1 Tax=Shinella sp. (strain HZN7) TaxID=879274 RepID=UPI000A94854D|nr:hypothetical protein [Shinella sp. HZN7]
MRKRNLWRVAALAAAIASPAQVHYPTAPVRWRRGTLTAAPGEWTTARVEKIAAWLKANSVSVVLLDAAP